jgi:hypothetical protein
MNIGLFCNGTMSRLMNAMFGIDPRISVSLRRGIFHSTTTRFSPFRARRGLTPIPRVNPGLCYFGPLGHRRAPKFFQRHLLQMSKLQRLPACIGALWMPPRCHVVYVPVPIYLAV